MDRNYKDEMDQWQSVPVYIDVVAWSYQAENICKIAHKGTAVLLEGRINTRSYVDSNNINRKVFENHCRSYPIFRADSQSGG
jgi:single-strand DNA-binding protein